MLAETAIQNLASRAGHAVPEVPIDSVGATIAGRPFIVMRRLPGATLLDVLSEDPMNALEPAARLMGRTQARLHNLDATGAVRSLELTGLDAGTYTPFKLLDDIHRLVEATQDKALGQLGNWLDEHRPESPGDLSVCHGDFHPANILVEDLKLTGVIDWGNYSFGHSEYDVAVTQFIVSIGPLEDSPVPLEQLRAMLDAFLDMYKGEYLAHRPINEELVGYYIVLRAGHALAKVVAARYGSDVRGTAHDGYSWARPLVYEHVRELVRDRTGVDAGPLEA